MNICIVNNSFGMGGVERVVIEFANSMQERGHNLSIISFSGNNEFYYTVNKGIERPRVIFPRTIRAKVIGKLTRIKNNIRKRYTNISILYKEQIRDLIDYLRIKKFDILIMNQGVLTALIPELKKELPNLKIVAWQHNEYEIYMNKYNKEIIRDYLMGVDQADLIVCLTEEDQKKFRKLNKNSTFIYNPLTLTNTDKKISKLTKKKIVFVGRLKLEQKGLDYLIELGKNIKNDWTIQVAGDGEDKKRFLQMIKANNLEERIVLKGALKGEELTDFYVSGSIFISTSRWEGFGLVITEAMSFGLPIISFDNSGPREILRNGQYGILVEKDNINEFSTKLNELIEDPVKRKYFQDKSIERVKSFESDIIMKEWELKLKEIL